MSQGLYLPTPHGLVATGNSSTTPLGSGGVFTGTASDVRDDAALSVSVAADQAGTLSLQWSSNNADWDLIQNIAIAANTPLAVTTAPRARWFRVVYTNGAAAQGAFRLETILRPFAVGPEIRDGLLRVDASGVPQAVVLDEPVAVEAANGALVTVGATTDAEATGDGSVIALLKRLRTLLGTENEEFEVAPSAARTVSFVSATFTNLRHTGVMIHLRITAAPVTPASTLRCLVQYRDPITGTAFSNLSPTATVVHITVVGLFNWIVYPALDASTPVFTSNSSGIQDIIGIPLPLMWRVVISQTPAGTGESWTYSVAATMLR